LRVIDFKRFLLILPLAFLAAVIFCRFGTGSTVLAAPTYDQDNGTYTDDFAGTTGILSSSGAGVSGGFVQLKNASGGYTAPFNSSGYVVSKDIRPTRVAKWGTVSIGGSFPEGTSVQLQALDDGGSLYADTYLVGNSAGIATFPVDVSGISPFAFGTDGTNANKIPSIRFKLILTTSDQAVTPRIDSFSFNWTLTQGDLSDSLFDSSSPWTNYYGDQKLTYRSRYSNSLVYPAFRWAKDRLVGNIAPVYIYVLSDRLFTNERWWNGRASVLDRDSGSVSSEYPFAGNQGGVITQNGTFYANNIGNDMTCVWDTVAGTPKWSYNFVSGHGNSHVAVGNDGTLYTFHASGSGTRVITLYAFDADSSIKWTKEYTLGEVGEYVNPSPIAVGDSGSLYYVYYTTNTSYVATPHSKLVALNPEDGSVEWEYLVEYSNLNPLVGDDGTIYVNDYRYSYQATRDFKVWAINPDGTLKWVKNFGSEGYGVFRLLLRNDGNLEAMYMDKASYSSLSLLVLDSDDGAILSQVESGGSITLYLTDSANGLFAVEGVAGSTAGTYVRRLEYFNSDGQLKWFARKTYSSRDDSCYSNSINFGGIALDERGWIYAGLAKSCSDSDGYSVYADQYSQVFAMVPWSLAVNSQPTFARSGSRFDFTVTTSMQKTNPLFGGDSQVQAYMDNGDKVTLAYDSIDSNSNTIWKGSYTFPGNYPEGNRVITIEAAQSNLQTDIALHFDNAPEESLNTGITAVVAFAYDNTGPVSNWVNEQQASRKFEALGDDYLFTNETLPSFSFTQTKDALTLVQKYQIILKDIYNREWVYIDDINPARPDSGNPSEMVDGKKFVRYTDDNILVHSLLSDDRLSGAYKWRVRSLDRIGNRTDSPEKVILVNTHQAVFSDDFFPLSIRQIESVAVNISSLRKDNPAQVKVYSRQPSFSGIASANSLVTLILTSQEEGVGSGEKFFSGTAAAGSDSRYWIRPDKALALGKYTVKLYAKKDEDYVELPEFTLILGEADMAFAPNGGVDINSDTGYSGGDRGAEPNRPKSMLVAPVPSLTPPPMDNWPRVYIDYCLGCRVADGLGDILKSEYLFKFATLIL